MIRFLPVILFFVWLSGCTTQTPIHKDPSTKSHTDSTDPTTNTIEGWQSEIPKQWRLYCTVEMVLNRSQNLKTSVQAEFEATRNSNEKDQFQFTSLSQPAYTTISYQTGFIPRISHTDVRTQVAQASEKEKAIQTAQNVLQEFEQKMRFEATHKKNENIIFTQNGGQFLFERSFDGSVQNIQQSMKTQYLYQKPEDDPVDFNPNIFPALEKALLFLVDSPLKSTKIKTVLALQQDYEWTTTSDDFLQKVAETTIAINPKLSFVINRHQKKELTWRWKVLEKTEDRLKTRAEVAPFSLQLQNYDFSLSSFSRNITFDRKRHYIEEDHFEAVFQGKEPLQEIRIQIKLHAKS